MRARLWLGLVLACLLATRWGAAQERAPELVPVLFHVAASQAPGESIEAFLARQLAQANDSFAPLGLRFEQAGRVPLAQKHAVLNTREERDALLPYVRKGVVHCMVVATLMDVDEPGRERRGVHWHRPNVSFPHLVILSVAAGDYVLAHELGHFFGNPAHSDLPGNLMSYTRGVVPPFLTDAQKQRVLRSLARMRKTGELR